MHRVISVNLLLWNFLLDLMLINGDIRCQSQLLWLAKTSKGRLSALTVMAFEDKSKDKETVIVRRAKSLDDLQWVMKMATEVGFRPVRKRLSATSQQVSPLISTLVS